MTADPAPDGRSRGRAALAGGGDVPEAIQWSEGMMLAPQHFQQLARRGEELLAYHVLTAAPFHWGIRRFEHDADLLPEGIFRVSRLEALMPDGLLVYHDAELHETLERKLQPFSTAMTDGPLTLYLAVAVRRGAGITESDGPLRYRSVDGPPVVDETAGGSEVRIPRQRPRLELVPVPHGEGPPDSRYVSFPLARLTRRNETFAFTDYQPPLLALTRGSPLGRQCIDAIRAIREKAVMLTEQGSSPALPAGSDSLRHIQNMLRSLLSGLPPFEAVVNANMCHPFPVYLALTGLIGPIATLGSGAMPPVLPAYDHNDLRASFQPAFDFINLMLDRVHETYTVHPFTFDGRRFWILMHSAFMAPTLTIGVRIPTGRRESDVVEWMNNALIGSESILQTLSGRRVLGAAREMIDRDEAIGVVPPRGVLLFRIIADPEIVKPQERLVVWRVGEAAEAIRPSEIQLYVGDRPPTEGGGASS